MKPKFAGYTLVELIAVLAILGLVAAMVWPKYQVVADELALRQDAAVLAREIRLARQSAITTGRECALFLRLVQAVINLPVTRSGRVRP